MQNYKKLPLLKLIKAAQNNDNSALDELVRRYQNKIYGSFCRLNPCEDLSDLTQEALMKMTKSINSLKNPEMFNVWLQKIVKNLFFDSLRHRNRKSANVTNPIENMSVGEFGDCVIDERKMPDENAINCELKRKINNAIEKLPTLSKTIILLREIDGLSYEEIAELTNMNIGTVKSRIARARVKLKKELEPYIQEK